MESLPKRIEEDAGETDEDAFRAYVADLELQPEDLRKKILDVGSGAGQFAKYAKERGINKDIVSVDPFNAISREVRGARADAVALPFRDGSFELVISDAAVPNVFLGGEPETVREQVRKSFEELVRVTAEGGEVRLGQVLKGEEYENQKVIAQAIDDALKLIEEKHRLAVEQIHKGNLFEYDETGTIPTQKVLARAYLIKIKKPYEYEARR